MSPQKTNSSLDVLADSCIASAQKELRRHASPSAAAASSSSAMAPIHGDKIIFATSADGQLQDGSVELSHIIKSTDSPDTISERGLNDAGLGDVSFSALAELSMLHASAENTPFHKIHTALSPIQAKSPDISMTPYLNCLTLDAASGGSRSQSGSALRSAQRAHQQVVGSAERPLSRSGAVLPESVVRDASTLNRSLFGTSTKRKRSSMVADGGDADYTHLYGHSSQVDESSAIDVGTAPRYALGRTRSTSSAVNTSLNAPPNTAVGHGYSTRTSQRLWADDSLVSEAGRNNTSVHGR